VLRIQGHTISFYLNDALVHTYEDTQPLSSGYWGAIVGSTRGDGPTQGHYRHILIAA
jgi:hypothetical protein